MHSTAATYQFSLVKGNEQYLVRCGAGLEEEAIERLMNWAEDPDMDFDWFDAAVLARQITQRMAGRTSSEEAPSSTDPETC
jgi:hypothetical protein